MGRLGVGRGGLGWAVLGWVRQVHDREGQACR